jgi:hypothetical protein
VAAQEALVGSNPETRIAPSPRTRSWVDALIALIERIPGPSWLFYLACAVVFGVASVALRWLDGSAQFGTANPVTTAFATGAVYPLAVVHYLNGAGRRSLRDFRPALGALDTRYDDLALSLTRMPQSTAIVALVLGVAAQILGSATSGGTWGITDRTSVGTAVFTVAVQIILDVFFAVFILRAARQLRMIARIHREATNIRLYDRLPHIAFARFTVITAVVVTIPYAIIEVGVGFFGEASLVEIVLLVLSVIFSVALFVVPLTGMHSRLVREKVDQFVQSDRAFEATTTLLHSEVRSGKLEQAESINKVLSSLVIETTHLKAVSTWPWSADTLRGFLSSVALPIVLWLITTAIDQVIPGG